MDYAAGVMPKHVIERGEGAVMHIGSRADDLAQPRRLECVLRHFEPQHRAPAAIVCQTLDEFILKSAGSETLAAA